MNKLIAMGNLGADPTLRSTPSGRPVCNFNIAVDRRYYSGQGEERRLVKEVDWIPVVVWGPLAETCAKHLQKGSKVLIEAEIRPRQYTDENNVRHNTFEATAREVKFIDKIRSTDTQVVENPEQMPV